MTPTLIIITLILFGIIALIAEFLLVPGIGIAGILGLGSIIYSAVYAFMQMGTTAGTIVTAVDIAIVPTSRVYHKGERFRIQIAGRYIREGWFEPLAWDTDNHGTHNIHTGGKYESWIEIPVVPPRYQAGEYIHR